MIMKKVQLITAGAFALLMASCGHTGERSDATNDSTMVTMSRAELESTLQTQDTLLALVNDISDDMMQRWNKFYPPRQAFNPKLHQKSSS